MEAIAYYAYEASSDLAAERGTYPSYAGSKWDRGLLPQDTLDAARGRARRADRGRRAAAALDWAPLRAKIAAQGMRNSNVHRDRADGDDREHHGHLALHRADLQEPVRQVEPLGRLRRPQPVPRARPQGRAASGTRQLAERAEGASTATSARSPAIPAELRERYRTAFQIEPEWLIDAAARRQKWIDQSQSLNLFLAAPRT